MTKGPKKIYLPMAASITGGVPDGEIWRVSGYSAAMFNGSAHDYMRKGYLIHDEQPLEPLMLAHLLKVKRMTGAEVERLRQVSGINFDKIARTDLDITILHFVHGVALQPRLATWAQLRDRVKEIAKVAKQCRALDKVLGFSTVDRTVTEDALSVDILVRHYFLKRFERVPASYFENIAATFEMELVRLKEFASKRGAKSAEELNQLIGGLFTFSENVGIRVTVPPGNTGESHVHKRHTKFSAFVDEVIKIACRKGEEALASSALSEEERKAASDKFRKYHSISLVGLAERLDDLRRSRKAGFKWRTRRPPKR